MLLSLSIRNVVLIDALDAVFESGLCALTGETGAGKSILLGALGLAAGERADRAQVRAGAEEAQAVAEFELPDDHPARAILDEAGIAVEPGEPLILRRRLGEDGRSRAHVNDQPASIGLLRSLGDVLVEVHGQHDGRGLMDPRTHRAYLDSYAGHDELRAACRTAWKEFAEARRRLDDLVSANRASDDEKAFLTHALEELEALQPKTGEEAELAEERQFLQGAERALGDLQDAQEALAGDGGGLEGRLNAALRGLERVRSHIGEGGGSAGEALGRAAAAIDRALIEFNEAEDALADAAQAFDVEPGRLDAVEERLFALRGLARKHNVDVDDLPALHGRLAEQLDAIENASDRIAEAEKAVASAKARYDDAAHALTRSREQAGEALAEAVAAELPPLKMDKARFRVSVVSDDERPARTGATPSSSRSRPIPARPSDRSTRSPPGGNSPVSAWR